MAKKEEKPEVIPAQRFHVSKANMRADEPFPQTEEDQTLIDQVRHGKIVEPFKARPEGKGLGVYVGKRRFQAKMAVGAKEFVVGSDVLIRDVSEEEAREESLVENLPILRKEIDPIRRAQTLSEVIAFSPTGLRGTARRLGLKPSTLSEWLKVLDLSPKMQEAVSKGVIPFSEGLEVARMEIGKEKQDELGQTLLKDGLDAFKSELLRIPTGKRKRGIPKGLYEIDRVVWDKRNRKHMDIYGVLQKISEKMGMKVPELIQDFIMKRIDEINKEYA